jgi:hypothetical protein
MNEFLLIRPYLFQLFGNVVISNNYFSSKCNNTSLSLWRTFHFDYRLIGETFNVLIFTTLKTFRKTSCGFYLTIISIANIGQIITAVFIRTVNYGFSINLLQLPWICQMREFSVHYFALIAFTTLCLATIDQFVSFIRPQWSSLRLAHRHIAIICCIWFGHNIPFLIYCDISGGRCRNLNVTFYNYVNYFV